MVEWNMVKVCVYETRLDVDGESSGAHGSIDIMTYEQLTIM